MKRNALLIIMLWLTLAACQSADSPDSATSPAKAPKQSNRADSFTPADRTIAYINSQPVVWGQLEAPLMEAAGGQVMLEQVIDRGVKRELAEANLSVTPDHIANEQKLLAESLSDDADQAQRLLDELRVRRGLGEERFKRLLARNAGLRLLIQKDVEVNDTAVRQAFEFQYGPRYEARLVVVTTMAEAGAVVRDAKAGKSFTELAMQRSTDESRAQGGMLSPISPADPTYPLAVRAVLPQLEIGQVSDPVAVENGFAVLKLERKIQGSGAKFDDVKEKLSRGVRLDVERMLMQRLARTLVAKADVVVLDAALQKSWNQQKKSIEPQMNTDGLR